MQRAHVDGRAPLAWPMALLPRGMAQRVALACALGFVVSSVTVALVTGLLAERQSLRQEDRHLQEAAYNLGQELAQRGGDPRIVVQREEHELEHTGMRLTMFERGRRLAGDSSLQEVATGSCRDQGSLRACGVRYASYTLVVARDQLARKEQREVTTRSALVAVLVTSVLATLLALSLSRALVRPLSRLARAVQQVDEPGSAALGPETEVREVEALRTSLQQAFQRLDVALTQSRSFASNAAHQLRTPLTAVLGELELAQEQLGDASPDELARAHRVASRLHVLIDRLLILAQPNERLSHVSNVDLLDVLEEALDTLPSWLRERVVHSGGSRFVRGDRSLLVAALVSALENALKFSEGQVRAGIEPGDGHALLFVEDEGPGIAAAERERVFAPFYRSSAAHAVAGHGLGLALIAHVLARHGGQARFVERTQGARIELRLPGSSTLS